MVDAAVRTSGLSVLEIVGEKLTLAATDRYRLAVRELEQLLQDLDRLPKGCQTDMPPLPPRVELGTVPKTYVRSGPGR